jgi:hypothetical protein
MAGGFWCECKGRPGRKAISNPAGGMPLAATRFQQVGAGQLFLGDLVGVYIRLSDAGAGDYWDDVDHIVRNHLVEQHASLNSTLLLGP